MMEFLTLKLENALDLADADPEQAAVVLREAAGFLRKGEPLPYPLALFLADKKMTFVCDKLLSFLICSKVA